jgi:hypothetical protein
MPFCIFSYAGGLAEWTAIEEGGRTPRSATASSSHKTTALPLSVEDAQVMVEGEALDATSFAQRDRFSRRLHPRPALIRWWAGSSSQTDRGTRSEGTLRL